MFLHFLHLVVTEPFIFCSIWEDKFILNQLATDKHPQRSKERSFTKNFKKEPHILENMYSNCHIRIHLASLQGKISIGHHISS